MTSEPGRQRLKANKKMVETLAKVRLARWLGLALRQSRPGKNSAKSSEREESETTQAKMASARQEFKRNKEKEKQRTPTSKIEKCTTSLSLSLFFSNTHTHIRSLPTRRTLTGRSARAHLTASSHYTLRATLRSDQRIVIRARELHSIHRQRGIAQHQAG